MSQHCWIRYVRKPGEAKAAASEIRICQRPPSEANWGKGETITPCFSQFRPADADPFIASRPQHVFKKNIVFRWKKNKTIKTETLISSLCLCMHRFHIFNLREWKAACSRGEANIIPFFWLAVSGVHVPTCTFHTRTHFFHFSAEWISAAVEDEPNLASGCPQTAEFNTVTWSGFSIRLKVMVKNVVDSRLQSHV